MAKVNGVWEKYSNSQIGFLTSEETRKFIIDLLLYHGEEQSCEAVECLMSNMDLSVDGKLDKYNLAVFFLRLAQLDDLIGKERIYA